VSDHKSKITILRGPITAVTASIIIVVILEVLVRVFLPQFGWSQRLDRNLGWSTNEYIQFDAASAAIREAGKKRILFLGDSVLAGGGVSRLENRFSNLLKEHLGASVAGRVFAAGGWGTDQELLAFMQKGKAWRPDVVVVAFTPNNDLANILSHSHGPKKFKPYFVVDEIGGLRLYDGYGNPLSYEAVTKTPETNPGFRSYLWSLIRGLQVSRKWFDFGDSRTERLQNVDPRYVHFRPKEERPHEIYERQETLSWSPQSGVNHVSAYIHENFPINTYQWRLLEEVLQELRVSVEAGGGTLVVMLVPMIYDPRQLETVAGGSFQERFRTPKGSFTFRSAEPRDRLRKICANVGAQFFDPTAQFIEHIRRNDLTERVWPDPNDRHFSDVGHKILAQISKDFFAGLLEK